MPRRKCLSFRCDSLADYAPQRFVHPARGPCDSKCASQGGAAPPRRGEGISLIACIRARTYHPLAARDRAQGPARNQREEARVAGQGRVAQVCVQPAGIRDASMFTLTRRVGTWRAASPPKVPSPSSKRARRVVFPTNGHQHCPMSISHPFQGIIPVTTTDHSRLPTLVVFYGFGCFCLDTDHCSILLLFGSAFAHSRRCLIRPLFISLSLALVVS